MTFFIKMMSLSRAAALPPSIAVSSSAVRPLVLSSLSDSDWSDHGLSVPNRIWSAPWGTDHLNELLFGQEVVVRSAFKDKSCVKPHMRSSD